MVSSRAGRRLCAGERASKSWSGKMAHIDGASRCCFKIAAMTDGVQRSGTGPCSFNAYSDSNHLAFVENFQVHNTLCGVKTPRKCGIKVKLTAFSQGIQAILPVNDYPAFQRDSSKSRNISYRVHRVHFHRCFAMLDSHSRLAGIKLMRDKETQDSLSDYKTAFKRSEITLEYLIEEISPALRILFEPGLLLCWCRGKRETRLSNMDIWKDLQKVRLVRLASAGSAALCAN